MRESVPTSFPLAEFPPSIDCLGAMGGDLLCQGFISHSFSAPWI